MAVQNYGYPYMPSIVKSILGNSSDRTSIKIPMKNSAALYLGQFISDIQNTQAQPNGAEFGAPGWTAHNMISGFVIGFSRSTGLLPLVDDSNAAGVVTNATGNLPYKYTAAATNDESNTSSAILELVEIMPVFNGDILEVTLWGASTLPVVRATSTAAGTTGSSDNIGVGIQINPTYPFSLLESTAAKDLTSADFVTTSIAGKKPRNTFKVFVKPLRASSSWTPTLN